MHEVWNILKRDKYTDKGAETIEKLQTLFRYLRKKYQQRIYKDLKMQ